MPVGLITNLNKHLRNLLCEIASSFLLKFTSFFQNFDILYGCWSQSYNHDLKKKDLRIERIPEVFFSPRSIRSMFDVIRDSINTVFPYITMTHRFVALGQAINHKFIDETSLIEMHFYELVFELCSIFILNTRNLE